MRKEQQTFSVREGPVRVAFRLPHSGRETQSFLQDDLPKVIALHMLLYRVMAKVF